MSSAKFSDAMLSYLDQGEPSMARVYNFLLGGEFNFDCDRDRANVLMKRLPGVRRMVRRNREFLGRSVQFMTQRGIRQFIDIGSGLPDRGATHEIIRKVCPSVTVVYVDRDPEVVGCGRLMIRDDEAATMIQADLAHPSTIFEHPELLKRVDFRRPVGVVIGAVLHFIQDDEDAGRVVHSIRRTLAPGSHLSMSHAVTDEVSSEMLDRVRDVDAALTPRPASQLLSFLPEFEVVPPGLVPVHRWRSHPSADAECPQEDDPGSELEKLLYGVVCRLR
ncbi:SAM-dependent methyltransferase [Streptomyces roseoverticillatus]|uniref:SAM-dependent methyltransferase n=1 Tax=Streptomyces roseoverticillatus TaxID=66429 RepID=UPI003407ED9F